jgi:hypothetical protein
MAQQLAKCNMPSKTGREGERGRKSTRIVEIDHETRDVDCSTPCLLDTF